MTALLTIIAVCLDVLLGEPRRWHPLVGFGRLAQVLERRLNTTVNPQSPVTLKVRGAAALAITVGPWVLLTAVAARTPILRYVVAVGSLYFALGHQSLRQHALRVHQALSRGIWSKRAAASA